MSKERYQQNRTRVFEIYGIAPDNKDYNCHHITQRCDVGVLVGLDFDIDSKSNLFPILIRDHEKLNQRIAELDGHIEQPKHKKKHKY
jgi:hypothetical protein